MLTVEDYSDKSYVVFGMKFEEQRKMLEDAGGMYNAALLRKSTNKREEGVIFAKSRHKLPDLQKTIAKDVVGNTPLPTNKTKTFSSLTSTNVLHQGSSSVANTATSNLSSSTSFSSSSLVSSSTKQSQPVDEDLKVLLANCLSRIENLEAENATIKMILQMQSSNSSSSTHVKPTTTAVKRPMTASTSRPSNSKSLKIQPSIQAQMSDDEDNDDTDVPLFMAHLDEE